VSTALDLLDYRRRVTEIYTAARAGGPGEETWNRWREARDDLFANHVQSAMEDTKAFTCLRYFDYDESWRTVGTFRPGPEESRAIANSDEGATAFTKIGVVEFAVAGHDTELEVLWLTSYGGGLFLPFRDLTNGEATYGGGRYLIDTVKGADLGHQSDRIVLDFNYAYHPSCVHSPRWSCPLAPPANRLAVAVTAGERLSEEL
jgi:uncharacterized protein